MVCVTALMAVTSAVVFGQPANSRTVSVWYRGQPAGVPRQDDLASLRALGFTHVTWPETHAGAAAEVRRLAEAVGLGVNVRRPSSPASSARAGAPTETRDVRVADVPAAALPALLWRAIADGARTVAFDPGVPAGTGTVDDSGALRPWVEPARAFARQIAANPSLYAQLDRGRRLALDPDIAGVDVHLFAAPRAWVLIATNTTSQRAIATTRMPPKVPYAPWSSLLDSGQMGMRIDRAGAIWRVILEPGAARVYLAARRPLGFQGSAGSGVPRFGFAVRGSGSGSGSLVQGSDREP